MMNPNMALKIRISKIIEKSLKIWTVICYSIPVLRGLTSLGLQSAILILGVKDCHLENIQIYDSKMWKNIIYISLALLTAD